MATLISAYAAGASFRGSIALTRTPVLPAPPACADPGLQVVTAHANDPETELIMNTLKLSDTQLILLSGQASARAAREDRTRFAWGMMP